MRNRNTTATRLTLLLSVLASLAYLGGGIALMASSQSFGIFPESSPLRIGLAALLSVYGAYRLYRAVIQVRNNGL